LPELPPIVGLWIRHGDNKDMTPAFCVETVAIVTRPACRLYGSSAGIG